MLPKFGSHLDKNSWKAVAAALIICMEALIKLYEEKGNIPDEVVDSAKDLVVKFNNLMEADNG